MRHDPRLAASPLCVVKLEAEGVTAAEVVAPRGTRLAIVIRAVDRAGNVGRPSRTVIRLRD
jgi:hypothetical protein